MTKILALLVVVWLVIGALAAFQRDYFEDSETNCAEAGSIALTILAGPLNYVGVNPEVDCEDVNVPEPSE
jgi:hypothetical protein